MRFKWIEDLNKMNFTITELYKSAIDPPVFYNQGMIKTFQEQTKEQVSLAVGLTDNNEQIIALPLVKNAHWQNVSYPGWDNLNVIKSNACSIENEQHFWTELLERLDVLKLVEWTQDSTVFNASSSIASQTFDRRKCPYIDLQSSWAELNNQLGKKLVRNIRQYGNKAKKLGISFEVFEAKTVSCEERLRLLEQAFGFHEKRMGDKEQDSVFTSDLTYHQSVMKHPDNLFFILARHNEKIIACYYGLYNDTRLAWFNGGYSPDYYKHSIGTLLVSELISYAYENGITIFDFLRGNEGYKQKWTSVHNRNQDVYLWKNSLGNTAKVKRMIFQDLRQRMGSKNALKQLLN